ncbi:hypothetical protein BLS_001344 [Venturia inaequalis]|uniref:Uncharacterized protein n=1 Tax=Venturia inaequalis TaxID=5025 RepID=A0A8H3VBU2_VENIN|nr:hypothetical protein EG327_008653 [Venturia inaequalis]KAE9977121.1 hypothetical protein EG328_002183 [Venturia inaequalis]KAE9984772.1 hypothetical protein BLS_001344 [Venturia inaequalis]RDI83233.1 hypothetical protein Vi05172_g6987 [Venturia inaequalis]
MSHRHKKQFQPSITSFFARADRDNAAPAVPVLSAPVLDNHIQASLAQVGMRVRKAVPEGYKTHKTVSAYTAPLSTGPMTTMRVSSRPSELLPFCGIHRIGGLSEQPMPGVNAYDAIDVFSDTTNPLADFATPFSSQESAVSTDSVTIPSAAPLRQISSNKRSYNLDEEEQESEESDFEKLVFNFPATLSPPRSTYPISHTTMPNLTAISSSSSSRAYAKPKSRRKEVGDITQQVNHGFGSADMDFEDANFLTPLDDGEVEMGGT